MHPNVGRVVAAASDAGLRISVQRFPEGTRTAADAARAVDCDVAQIVKSLVFVAGDELFLALTSGANRADAGRLSVLMDGREIRQADANEARTATGFAIGGTPPFGHPRPLRVFCDRDLLAHEVVWAAAGTPSSVFPLSPQELLRASGAEPAAFKE